MVLNASDYSVSNLWESNWDPTSPRRFLTRAVGTVAAISFALFLFAYSQNAVLPRLNSLVSRYTGGRVSTGGGVEVF